MIERLSRALAWASIAAILVLSVVPAQMRPVTSLPHDLEHFGIFVLCGLGFGVGYHKAAIVEGLALVTFAGAIEILQLFSSGRHARLTDFAVDAIASCVGVLAGSVATMIVPKG